MRVATVDGLVTLFYDGSKELWNRQLDIEWWDAQHRRNHDEDDDVETLDVSALDVSDECREYWRERLSWQQIIIVEGVTDIPYMTFSGCKNIKRVIFSNTVIRIEQCAFISCKNLVYIKWSMNLEYIGPYAFEECNLSSAFIPPRCREVCDEAFASNRNLSIFHVPQDTELGQGIIYRTALAKASPPMAGDYNFMQTIRMNRWIKTMNNEEEFVLHRVCSSFRPLKEDIHAIVQEKGLKVFSEENGAGITPSRYLKENPYCALKEKDVIQEYLMKMLGESE